MSQVDLGKALGVSQQALNRILNGDPVGYYIAQRLAAYDRVPVWSFLEGGPPALETVLRSRRWSEWTAAAVRMRSKEAGQKYARYTEEDWGRFLDIVERTLLPVMRHGSKKK